MISGEKGAEVVAIMGMREGGLMESCGFVDLGALEVRRAERI